MTEGHAPSFIGRVQFRHSNTNSMLEGRFLATKNRPGEFPHAVRETVRGFPEVDASGRLAYMSADCVDRLEGTERNGPNNEKMNSLYETRTASPRIMS